MIRQPVRAVRDGTVRADALTLRSIQVQHAAIRTLAGIWLEQSLTYVPPLLDPLADPLDPLAEPLDPLADPVGAGNPTGRPARARRRLASVRAGGDVASARGDG